MYKYFAQHTKCLKWQVFVCLICCSTFAFAQNDRWGLYTEKWQFRKVGETQWHPATVPGTVHTDLYDNELIPDPFYADNEKQLQWIENENWEYATTFILSKRHLAHDHIEIEFEGLDTYATVYLNDSLILTADNMFRLWRKDIKKYVRKGKNSLRVVFESAVKRGKEEVKKLPYTLPGDEKIFSRKAQYQYGWDWGPRFVTCGIMKPVKIRLWDDIVIRNVYCVQKSLTDSLAQLSFVFEVDCDKDGIFYPIVKPVIGEQYDAGMYTEQPTNTFFKKGHNKVTVEYFIRNPKRWWCNGLGKANVYYFDATLNKKNSYVDWADVSIGLRTIELVKEKDKAGSSFYFKLNGVPVFMKGANYIPPDNFLSRIDPLHYDFDVSIAQSMNMNMLRVWGGGVYADDAFYRACDQYGILVWQDFMFACAMYPGDEAFVSNVKQEVIDNVNRLKNHPCLALWCGNNESDEGWKNWGWQKQYRYSKEDSAKIWKDYVHLFQDVIPTTLDSLEPGVAYVSSSPQIGWGHKESLQQGDSHYWGVWWGMEPFETYEKKVGRFMSEYGFQGMPALSTFKKFASDSALNFSSPAIKNHQKHPTGYATIQTYMERDYKVPKSFENYVYVSQLLQARGMKTAIEAHRRAKPYCMGTLYWQLNDCWPVTSWSSIDYYKTPKALWFTIKESYRDLIISVGEKTDSLDIYLVSDKQTEIKGTLWIHLLELNGVSSYSQSITYTTPPNSSTVCFRLSRKTLSEQIEKSPLLYLSFSYDKDTISTTHLLKKPKDLQLSRPEIVCSILDDHTIELSTDVFAGSVYLSYPNTSFSDNYFDLLPGEKKKVGFYTSSKDLPVRPAIKSLFDMNE